MLNFDIYLKQYSHGSHFCDFWEWLPSKMANNMIADQRWSPKVPPTQSRILSFEEFSDIRFHLTLPGFNLTPVNVNLTSCKIIFFALRGKIPKIVGQKLALNQ